MTDAPAGLAVRQAAPADVDVVVDLVEAAYRGERSRAGWTTEADLLDGQRTDAAEVGDLLARPGSLILVAADRTGGPPVGCAHLERRGMNAAFGLFAVCPGRQGGGRGSGLLAAAERLAAERWGSCAMELTVIAQRRDLIAWYERRGYRRTGETRPFPYGDERFGRPRRPDLHFAVLAKRLGAGKAPPARR